MRILVDLAVGAFRALCSVSYGIGMLLLYALTMIAGFYVGAKLVMMFG